MSCRVLGFSPQGYHAWRTDPVSQRDCDDAHLLNAAMAVHADDATFGYRLIADELRADGHRVGDNRVARICQLGGVASVIGRKRSRSIKTGPPAHDDHVRRDFTADAPNRLWLTDITEHPTGEGKVYLCAVKDVWSNRIVGYALADRMTAGLACAALEHALASSRRENRSMTVARYRRGTQLLDGAPRNQRSRPRTRNGALARPRHRR